MKRILPILLLLLAASCRMPSTMPQGGIMEYATGLYLEENGSGFEAFVANPWKDGAVLSSYRFDGSFDRVVVMSNNIARLMVELGLEDCIAGVCEPENITDSTVCARLRSGRIADCGNSMYPTIERIMELHPDAILVTPFEDSGYGQLESTGIPLVECADYMETSALGRAEWMRFYGRLFGAGDKADTLFRQVRDSYETLKEMAARTTLRPKVMLDTRSGSAWYVAGGKSTIAQVISDAGAVYAFGDSERSGSVPMSFESVYAKASDSDVWLLKNSTSGRLTYGLLEQDFGSYREFRPFRERNIWVCDVYRVPYFEETAFHPEYLLGEFMTIFHPELSFSRRFYHPLD